ncbi:MAG: hypothetical protein JWO06_2962 [Bacteroidota bacterium]|nr:hypothetical protein [Bacteroidota bacterium]
MKYSKLIFTGSVIAMAGFLTSCNDKPKPTPGDTSVTPSGKAQYSDSASSSVRVFDQNGKVCIQQSNTSYEVVEAYEGKTKIPLLLKVKKTELCMADSVNKDKVYEISAKSVMDSKSVAWEAKFVATGLEFKDNTMIATHEGGEGEEDFIKIFGLFDGKEVFSCSYGGLKVSIPNVKEKRFIGFTSRKAVAQPLKGQGEENLLGLIRFGSSSKPIEAFAVNLKRSKISPKMPTSTPDMVLVPANTNTTAIEDGKTLILMKANENFQPADVKDFSVKFTFYYGDDNESTDIVIPVVNDKLNLAAAKYDKELFDIKPF